MEKIVNLLTFGAVVFVFAAAVNAQSAVTPVSSVDLDRYAGRWYEIAKYPNKFQKQCVGNTTATYTRKANGKIEVVNECLKNDGKVDRAKGEAKIVDKASNAKLKVRFAPAFLSFLPAVWGDYWVLDLGADYEYSVIGEPGRDYLWILSRQPKIAEETYEMILKKVEAMGFERGRVQLTPQGMPTGRSSQASSD